MSGLLYFMNQFAQGGFELIEEEIPDETELADWMSVYIDMLMEEPHVCLPLPPPPLEAPESNVR